MIHVIVKNGADIVGKEVYSGDDQVSSENIAKKQAANPSLVYAIVEEKVFDETAMSEKLSPEMADWKTAKVKGADVALSFLAQKLGLE